MGIIYKITNQQTGKIYIGKTIKTLKDRFAEHVSNGRKMAGASAISRSLREYGTINHTIEILEECDNELLLMREQYWIDKLNSKYTGYNIKNEYCFDTREYWENKDKALTNINNGLVWNKGITPPISTRTRISTTKKKKYELGLYENSYGHKHTEETKAKLAVIAKARPKPLEQTKEKCRIQSTGRVFYFNISEKKRIFLKKDDIVPPGYIKGKGTIWVNKDGNSISIDVWNKDYYLEQGYSEGRVNVG